MNELGAILDSMLAKIPGVVVTRKLNSTNFTVAKKVFAFTNGDGVVMKLPPAVIKRLLEDGTATRLVMGKRVMKEWVVIRRQNLSEFKRDLSLFKKALAFVASGAGEKKFISRKKTDQRATTAGDTSDE